MIEVYIIGVILLYCDNSKDYFQSDGLPPCPSDFLYVMKGGEIVAEKRLTAKQQRFCDEYLIDLNATQAAIRAGYKEKTARVIACENLTKPYIREYIDQRMKEKEAALIADQDEVLKYLTSVLRGETRSSVVVVENVGDFMSEAREMSKAPDEKERLKAAELLGKRYSLFTDKIQQEFDGELKITVDYGDDE